VAAIVITFRDVECADRRERFSVFPAGFVFVFTMILW